MENVLKGYLEGITSVNKEFMVEAQAYVDSLVKPPTSLGRLEDFAVTLAGITGELKGDYKKRASIICCSDNGVAPEGVTSVGQEFTATQTVNMIKGITGAYVLNKAVGADLLVVDLGVMADLTAYPEIYHRKISYGTNNIKYGPAMTREQCLQGVITGIEMVKTAIDKGYKILGTGEVGMGNTTTAAALAAVLCDMPPAKTVGKGAGLSDEAYLNKIAIVEQAISVNKPDASDPIDVIAKVGGYDIAAMTGIFIGAAYYKIPVIVDGVISISAALSAVRLNPLVRDYLLPSHRSFEQGYVVMSAELDLQPIFDTNFRLGEATGCPMAFNFVDLAVAMLDMATLVDAGTPDNYVDNVFDYSFEDKRNK